MPHKPLFCSHVVSNTKTRNSKTRKTQIVLFRGSVFSRFRVLFRGSTVLPWQVRRPEVLLVSLPEIVPRVRVAQATEMLERERRGDAAHLRADVVRQIE